MIKLIEFYELGTLIRTVTMMHGQEEGGKEKQKQKSDNRQQVISFSKEEHETLCAYFTSQVRLREGKDCMSNYMTD